MSGWLICSTLATRASSLLLLLLHNTTDWWWRTDTARQECQTFLRLKALWSQQGLRPAAVLGVSLLSSLGSVSDRERERERELYLALLRLMADLPADSLIVLMAAEYF